MSRVAGRLRAAAAGATSGPYVRITTTGATFSPVIEGPTGTVTWTVEETGTVATGLTPTINFGSAATRHVRMRVPAGLGTVTTLNLGFDHTQDEGRYTLGATYDKAAESVAAVEDLTLCTGLVRFMAAGTDLAGTLDLTGLSALEYVECYGADVEAITLTGCTSLIRLCLEGCDLTELDINPVAANLRDLRAAAQQGGALSLTALTADLAQLYHLCVRGTTGYTVTGLPSASRLPAVEELWVWEAGLNGALTVPASATDVRLYGNTFTGVDASGCTGIQVLDLHSCGLTEAAVDAVLAGLVTSGSHGYATDLRTNTAPSAAGLASAATLTGLGWIVHVDA